MISPPGAGLKSGKQKVTGKILPLETDIRLTIISDTNMLVKNSFSEVEGPDIFI